MVQVVKHITDLVKIKEISLFLLLSLSILLKANAQYKPADGIKTQVFRMYLCEGTKKDTGINGAYLIQKGSNDTLSANALLKGDSLILKCNVEYILLFQGRTKWDYLTQFNIENSSYTKTVSFCFDRLKNKHHKHRLVNDYWLSDGFNIISGFSKRMDKAKK